MAEAISSEVQELSTELNSNGEIILGKSDLTNADLQSDTVPVSLNLSNPTSSRRASDSMDSSQPDRTSTENDREKGSVSSPDCMEPCPPQPITKGSDSPKAIQQNLLRKVNMAGSNGHGGNRQDTPTTTTAGAQPAQKSVFSIFKKKTLPLATKPSSSHETMIHVAESSTTGLILENRPRSLPAKSASEERKHQKMYQEMLTSARKKELKQAEDKIKQEKQKLEKDRLIADLQKQWTEILPKFSSMRSNRKVREIWWHGLPPGVRGTVWKKAIGNDLNISQDLYRICLKRCTDRLEMAEQRSRSDSSISVKSLSKENSVEVIHLDILRTFPTLGFFQEGGPYHSILRDILGAYACYRPDIGYVQGMSFLAGVLLLNMEAADAFICLANLLNRPSYLAFFKVEHDLMKPYFKMFSALMEELLPQLHAHFSQLEFTPEFYLIEWIFTMYTRVLPLDVACRVWDLFCRDGDVFLYRTALGILHMAQRSLIELNGIEEVGQFLGKLSSADCSTLFQHIGSINLTEKKFKQILNHT